MIQNVGGDKNAPYVAGDYLDLVVTAVDGAGAPLNISGAANLRYSISAILANGQPSGSPLLTRALGSGVAITDAGAGLFVVTLENGATGDLSGPYYHEAELIDDDGRVVTLFQGWIKIAPQLILPVAT